MTNEGAAWRPPPDRPLSVRDQALAAAPSHLREAMLRRGADHGITAHDPAWLFVLWAFRSRASADAADAAVVEINAALERLPSMIGTGAAGALSSVAREAAHQVGDLIAKPAILSLDRAARLGARRARLETVASALLSASLIWTLAMLFVSHLVVLPLPSRLAAVAEAPAWLLLIIQAFAVSVAFLMAGAKK